MDLVLLAEEMEVQVLLEVAVGPHSSEFEDCFGTRHAPGRPRQIEVILDPVGAGAPDDATGNDPSRLQRLRAVQVGPVVEQVGEAGVSALPPG